MLPRVVRLAVILLVACSSPQAPPPPSNQIEAVKPCDECLNEALHVVAHPEYSVSAQKNFERGKAAMEAGNFVLAIRYFEFLRSRFPYSEYAAKVEDELRRNASLIKRFETDCVARCQNSCRRSCPTVETKCTEHCSTRDLIAR
jgi:hypothetical protein